MIFLDFTSIVSVALESEGVLTCVQMVHKQGLPR